MKGTTRKIRGWGVYYSRTNQSLYLLDSPKHYDIDDLGSSYVQMMCDTFFEFITAMDGE